MTGLSKALGIVAILSRADRRYGPCWHGDIPAALRVVDGDTVNVLDVEASTSEVFRWLDIAVRALHVRYSPCLRRSHNLNYSVHFEMNCAVQFALRRSGGLTPGHILSDRMRYRGTGVGWAGKWPIRMRRFAR
ncbi:MAG: hypothetical protein K2X52_25480 [Mycobacteriaceae bacterium]|jgi:hypothetical protein|nr:hypothetical protein [Mycobacteriaceae bacterium]